MSTEIEISPHNENSQVSESIENVSDRESSIESFHTNKSELSIPTESELIDIDDIELSDEESWLYKSPKKISSEEKSASTQKWIQHTVDENPKETRQALLSKLNQLKYRSSRNLEKESKKEVVLPTSFDNKSTLHSKSENFSDEITPVIFKSEDVNAFYDQEKLIKPECQDWKDKPILDVVDVQKMAKLQEESLKQSTYKFLNNSALNTCSDGINPSNVCSIAPFQGVRKQSLFGSSSALNASQEFHRGSLPNINKGYYSLKSRKSKRPSEPKVSCPLPMHPTHSKITQNGSLQTSPEYNKSFPSIDNRQSNTLPSSYRVNCRRNSSITRSNSSSRRDLSCQSPSPRRESMPFTGINSPLSNQRKFSSPVPSVTSPRYSSATNISPTIVFNAQSYAAKYSPDADYHRSASHSPARRLPLSMVQHQSPKKEHYLKNGEIRQIPVKRPSKILNPTVRSGIPVPSSCSPRSDDDTWSDECY